MFGQGEPDDDADALRQTDITQPALYVHSAAVLAVLAAEGVTFDMAAGHSLGEYSALAAAGAISFEDGLLIVRERGRLMAEAGTVRPGAMAAIIGMEDSDLEAACAEASEGEAVACPANYNSPGQIVISGDRDAVARACALASERGARKVIPLPVSGAFHSPLMAFARDGLGNALSSLAICPPRVPVYLNVTGRPTTDPEEIRARLLEQLLSPVRWTQSIQAMHADGADRFVEVGAGRVLSGLTKRIIGRDAVTTAIGTADDILALTTE
jgi:[acyl-carrier-protein] S-malonyltransferase